jgi:autotransporter-associated beta strand protein
LVLGGTNGYTGLTAVNAGTLQLTNINNTASSNAPVLYLSFDNVTNGVVVNQGSGGHAMDGFLMGNASIVPGGRYGNALNIPAGAATAGYVFVNNAVVPLNITAGNTWTVAMWIQTTTAGAAYFYQGAGGWASGNTEFYLENGTAGDGAGSHVGGVRYAQGWESGTATINDGNWHFIVMTCTNAVKTIYVDGAVDAFISGVNQWSAAGTGTQLRIGGTAASSDSQIALGGLIDEVYIYNRALGQTEIQSVMNTSSGPTYLTPMPAASAVSLAAPGKLDLNGNAAFIAALSGSGTVDNTLGSGTLMVNATANVEFDGVISNTAGTASLTKLGNATLTLGGTNIYTGATTVNGGTLNITGALEPSTTAAATSYMVVGAGAGNSVVNFSGTYMTNYDYTIGAVSNAVGALYQTAGVLRESQGASGNAIQIGNAIGAYGYYYIGAGATNSCGEVGVAGEGNSANGYAAGAGNGIMDINGGTVNNTGWFVMSRAAAAQTGVLDIYPGSSLTYAGGGLVCNWGAGQTSIINMLGGTVTLTTANEPINLNDTGNAANIGILNLNGGSIQAGWVTGGANGTYVNFNGGTLAATENQTVMMSGLAAATVYSGGGTINNNGFNLTFAQQFMSPAGSGVSGISSFTGGAGYISPPIVTVVPSDGNGVGATAIAQINPLTKVVTNILITCPGFNYTATPTFTLTGGGATTPATITGAAPTANTSGSLTFIGSGTTLLNGGYTYTGPTVVNGGTLSLVSSTVTPSVAGDIIVSNATLTVNSTSGTALPANNLKLFTNSVLNLTTSPTANGINAAANLVLDTNVTLNIGYGTVFANPTAPAINVSGSISETATASAVINITGFGLKSGTFTVIKYTGTPLASIANLTLTLPPGVAGTLINNTGNDSIDVNIGSSPNQLTWSGVNGKNWDTVSYNWTNNATGLAAVYQQYTNGSVVAGDGVTFDDTLTNDFVNPQPTNVNLTTVYSPFPVTVNSTLPYSISGPGAISGTGNFIKNNTGSLSLLTSNSFTGGFAINGGSVIVTNDFSLGASSGLVTLNTGTLQVNGNTTNNARPFAIPATATIDIVTNVIARFGGAVTGAGGLTKTDNGTLVLAGSNAITGTLTVNQGTLTTLGTNILAAVPIIGNAVGYNGILNIAGGVFRDNNNPAQVYNSSLTIGNVGGAAGDVVMSAGTLTVPKQLTIGPTTYGAFSQSGGTTTIGGFIACGGTANGGVFNQTGGTVNQTNTSATIGYAANTTFGVMNLSGTAVFNESGAGNGIWPGEVGNGTLNVSGSAVLTVTNDGLVFGRNGGTGTANLLGGLTAVNFVTNGTGYGMLNFNGGTLKALSASTVFIKGATARMPIFVYNGGAAFDDGGFAVAISQPLLAPPSYGVASIPVVPGTSGGYIDTPIVTISGGNGSNAMATATVSGGAVTAITVTCPGSGYQNGDSLSVSFVGGGANPTPPTIGTITFVANGTGGLTKKGSGTLTLTGVNTFTGPITNSAGTLSLNSSSTYSSAAVNAGTLAMSTASVFTGGITILNGASLTITQLGGATNIMGNLTLNGGAAIPGATLGLGLTGLNPTVALVNCGVLTINGTNTVSIAGAVNLGTIPLVKYASFAGTGTYTNITLPQGVAGYVSNSIANSTLYVVITSAGPGLVWTGTNTTPGLTNLWDISSTTNWLLGATLTSYHQPIIPGDAVTFNDSGSGTVILNTNAGPSSLVISNNSKTYTFSGIGTISGSTGINKVGTGTALLNLTNNSYTGDTTVSNGTLQVGSASALSSAANLNVGPGGTLELAGFSETISGLNGSGIIDNNSANNVVLTLGNGGGGTWNGTIQDQGLGGGVELSKSGNNTLVIGGTNYLNNTAASQVNAGVTIITNKAVVNCANSEFWVGSVAGGTATNIVNGGTLTVANNYLVVGRGSATANGTLIVNSGTVQKAGANVFVVGSLGATGTLIVNGGQVLNNSELWLGESPSAVATLYLNGGLVQATDIRENSNGGFPTTPGYAYFNGGTLQASAASVDFLQVQGLVMVNGLVLDDNGFALNIASQPLQDGDGLGGGLIKKGSGEVYLDAANSYTGTTLVTNGTLAGIGSITGPVVVAPAGNLGAGDAGATVGTLTINNNLALQGKATLRINKTGGSPVQDQVVVSGNINYGGTLTVSNITSDATPLTTSDTFQLFSVTGSPNGNFTSIAGTPGTGLAYSFNPTSGVLSIVTSTIASNPTNITATVTGSTLALSWPADHLGWILQSQTNALSTGLRNNWVDVAGSAAVTSTNEPIIPSNPTVFYRLRHP